MNPYRVAYWAITTAVFLVLLRKTTDRSNPLTVASSTLGSVMAALFWPLTAFTLGYYVVKVRVLKLPMTKDDRVAGVEILLCIIVGGSLLSAVLLYLQCEYNGRCI